MINHTRTLLLNRSGAIRSTTSGEFVEPTFHTIPLPEWMQSIQMILMPAGMTDYQRDLRILCLMQALHHQDLMPYVLLFDPRITYSLDQNYFTQLQLAGLTVTKQTTGTDMGVVYYAASDPRDLKLTAGEYQWDFTPAYEGLNILAERYRGKLRERTVVFRGATSEHLELLPNYLYMYLVDDAKQLTGGFHFRVQLQVPLQFDILALLRRFESLDRTAAMAARVFTDWDLYHTELQNLRLMWYQSSELIVRFGAFVLAYAIQLERLRRGLSIPGIGHNTVVRVA